MQSLSPKNENFINTSKKIFKIGIKLFQQYTTLHEIESFS